MSALLQLDKMCSVHVDVLAQVDKVDRKCRVCVDALTDSGRLLSTINCCHYILKSLLYKHVQY